MFQLPASTEFKRRIPKQTFYAKLTLAPEVKRAFAEQINTITWSNKISPETINLARSETVQEIQVFTIRLNQATLDARILQLIDKQIPYHIVFVLEYSNRQQAWVCYKEASLAGSNAFQVGVYYHTDWVNADELSLRIEGLSMEAAYEGFVRQIAGKRLMGGGRLKEDVERAKKRQQLEKQIAALEKRIANEKQFNRQVELNGELKDYMKELELLNGSI